MSKNLELYVLWLNIKVKALLGAHQCILCGRAARKSAVDDLSPRHLINCV
jgi:hypothetical protein